ncbi:MAG: hypothetical protein M3Q97_05185, partial [Bacteroidota bacterium]|nr:hypothetical protein [Bacteroidota bacterium]
MPPFLLIINTVLDKVERRLTLWGAGSLLGIVLLLLVSAYVMPRFNAAFHGEQYSTLSKAPLDFENQYGVQYRQLGPMLGYLTGLKGHLFFILPLIFAFLFIAAVYIMYRRKLYEPMDALVMTLIITFSCTLFIPLISPGYTDTLSYFFLFLAFACTGSPFMCAITFALAMLNHESNVVLLPALILLAGKNNPQWGRFKYPLAALLLIISLIPLLW